MFYNAFKVFQNVPLKIFWLSQILFFLGLAVGIWYFDRHFPSFLLGFCVGVVFAVAGFFQAAFLFGRKKKKISLASFLFWFFKWGVFVFVLVFAIQKLDRLAFLVGLSSLLSFSFVFALLSDRK